MVVYVYVLQAQVALHYRNIQLRLPNYMRVCPITLLVGRRKRIHTGNKYLFYGQTVH